MFNSFYIYIYTYTTTNIIPSVNKLDRPIILRLGYSILLLLLLVPDILYPNAITSFIFGGSNFNKLKKLYFSFDIRFDQIF